MNETLTKQKFQSFSLENDLLLRWFEPLGKATKLLVSALTLKSLRQFNWRLFLSKCYWMGVESLPLVLVSAVFVSLTLTLQTVLIMRAMRTQDYAGSVIAIGLLRELGPLTVSLAWCARVAAHVCAEARNFGNDLPDSDYAVNFILPNLLAGLLTSIPLSAVGLVFGFLSAAFFAPTLGVTSANDFLESARFYIRDRDVITYFVKLVLINPVIGVLVGSAFGRLPNQTQTKATANAVTATFLVGFTVNWFITYLIFYHP
jgi:phospholipid/cholesterol/gamma-HCH transport system permease protein